MALAFKEVCTVLREKGFFVITHPVAKHHLIKDFKDYDITNHRFYIIPVGDDHSPADITSDYYDYLHVAIIEYVYGQNQRAVQVRYTCAGDDLLYGLRIKFNSGGSDDNETDLAHIFELINSKHIASHERYIRKRFRYGRTKAKMRALFVYVRDLWKQYWPFSK